MELRQRGDGVVEYLESITPWCPWTICYDGDDIEVGVEVGVEIDAGDVPSGDNGCRRGLFRAVGPLSPLPCPCSSSVFCGPLHTTRTAASPRTLGRRPR